jgi:hypothetical protein
MEKSQEIDTVHVMPMNNLTERPGRSPFLLGTSEGWTELAVWTACLSSFPRIVVVQRTIRLVFFAALEAHRPLAQTARLNMIVAEGSRALHALRVCLM